MKPRIDSNAKPRKKERKSRRRLGAHQYKNYTNEMLELAAELVIKKQMSAREAARQFSIPKQTILNKIHKSHDKPVGCPTRLSPQEESKIVKVLIAAGEFGSPLSKLDLRIVVFRYLVKNSRQDLFNGQLPGKAWVDNFLSRHASDLTVRSTQNIKKARAEKTVEDILAYFENLKETLRDIPASNILNFDETNVTDDPGSSKCIFRRGVKYPERVINSTKGAISLMFSGTADGVILPVYVVYKAEHSVFSEWIQGGPRDARYNNTKSGWFDSPTFEDYFRTIVLEWADSLPGQKAVICDNLSSHLSVEVIEMCENHDIKFVFIPANSTHMTQPLDVAFFGPLKKKWRKILLQYKMDNPQQTTLNKNHFPKLLKSLIEEIKLRNSDNIKSGFKAAGIIPLNAREVLKKIPEYHEDLGSYEIDQALLDYLKETRQPKPWKVTRNKRVVKEPGKSVTVSDLQKTTAPESSVPSVRDGVKHRKNNRINKKNKQKIDVQTENQTENRDLINDNIEKDVTQLSNNMCEDEDTENIMFLNEKTGLLEAKVRTYPSNNTKMDGPLIKIPGNLNNETEIKLLSSVTLAQPSTSTGRRHQSALYFRPHVQYYDSDNDTDEDKENIPEEIGVKRTGEMKKEDRPSLSTERYIECDETEALSFYRPHVQFLNSDRESDEDNENILGESGNKRNNETEKRNRPLLSTENYRECEETEEIMTIENKLLKKEMEPAKTNRTLNSLFFKKPRPTSDSDTDVTENISYRDSSDSGGFLSKESEDEFEINAKENNKYHKIKTETEQHDRLEYAAQNDVQVGTYVLVKFNTDKSSKYYVGKVTKVDGILVTVNFMRKKRNNTFSWPQVQDVSEMYAFDIVEVLPKPIDMRRGLLKFDMDLSKFNVL